MAPSFPVPRSALPKLHVTPEEHHTAKQMMVRMLGHTVQAFENFAYDAQGVVDASRWKPLSTQDDLKLFKERAAGATSSGLAAALGPTALLPNNDSVGALNSPTMMMTGCCPGSVATSMSAAISQTQEDLSLLVNFMHEDVADCAVLHTMEAPTPDKPYHYLGYKYFVRRSPGAPGLVKHRDSLYLEYSGTTRTRQGEVLGFVLLHSVDLPQFPRLDKYNSIRALQSVRYLYRQRSHEVVEVFMLGNLDVSGLIIRPIADTLAHMTLFSLVKLTDCAEAKRLTRMVRHRRPSVAQRSRHPDADECMLCGKTSKKSTFSSSSSKRLAKCEACGLFVCPHCRATKKIYIPNADQIMGKFQKVEVCMTCVVEANEGTEENPMPLPISLPNPPCYSMRSLPQSQRRTASTSSGDSGYPQSGRSDTSVASISAAVSTLELQGRPKSHSSASSYSSCSSTGSYSSAIQVTPVAGGSPTYEGAARHSPIQRRPQTQTQTHSYSTNCRGGSNRSRHRTSISMMSRPSEDATELAPNTRARGHSTGSPEPGRTPPQAGSVRSNSSGRPPVPISASGVSPPVATRISPSPSVGNSSTSCSPQEAMYARLLELNDVAEQTSAYVSSRGQRLS